MSDLALIPEGQSDTPGTAGATIPNAGAAVPGTAGPTVTPVDPASAVDPGGVLAPVDPGAASSPGAVEPQEVAVPRTAFTAASDLVDTAKLLDESQQAELRDNMRAAIVSESNNPCVYPLDVPTATPETNTTHPSVVYFKDSWNGFRYWMAHTPYPRMSGGSPADYENPTIAASHDGITWVEPAGISNPITTLADAQAIGAEGWSDTHLVYNPANDTLCCYYRNLGGTANESVRLKKSTDGVTWGNEIVVIDEGVAAGSQLMSPCVVIEDDLTWSMWVVNIGTNAIRKFTSANGESFSSPTNCTMPSDRLHWHMDVQKYHGKYYMLMNEGRRWSLMMYESDDGVTFEGDKFPFVPRTGTDLDSGGNYRSCFLPVEHDKMRIWAVGMSGDLEDNNNAKNHKVFYLERDYKYRDANQYRPSRNIIDIVDNFIAGKTITATGDQIGDLGWYFYGNGTSKSAKLGAFHNWYGYPPAIGGVRLTTAPENGTVAGINWNGGVSTFVTNRGQIAKLGQFEMYFCFRANQSDSDIWIGLGSKVSAGAPSRFAGLRALSSDTNWMFVCQNTSGTPDVVDSGLAKHLSIAEFTLGFDGTNWLMNISQSSPKTVLNSIGTTDGITPLAKVDTSAAASKTLDIAQFSFFGIKK